ncbi:methyl-accepting chemotaxis protein [Pleomorphomonas sp. NRK KF1]|uniref:methyl-accepting chemotaxis protein n=1 Tax=Pleomorphomonas sp. NRK KF1 TaxID=2943000 RepID=UPI002044986A|nr:methyl-accepting chemotaxis protein [Pleomorphomonas sp. NRK KF1]MCM5554118.1 methyl-accepting chemotaxis protein [Pleomorphomonas sp. NRK KF1]
MSLSRLLSISILFIALIACAIATSAALRQYGVLAEAEQGAVRLATLRAVSDIPNQMNGERGLTTLLSQSKSPEEIKASGELSTLRGKTDAVMAKARAAVDAATADGLDGADALNAAMTGIETEFKAARTLSDEKLALPVDQRGDAVKAITEKFTAINTSAGTVMATQTRLLSRSSGVAFRWANIASTAWDLRNYGGRFAGTMQTVVAAAQPVTPEQKVELAMLRGPTNQVWGTLAALGDLPDTPAAFKAALADTKSGYVDYYAGILAEVEPGFADGKFPYDGAGYRSRTVAMWEKVIGLRDAAFNVAADALDATIAQSRSNLWVSLGSLIAAVVGSAAVLFVVRRRVIRPLTSMTGAIGRIAQGDLDTAIPGVGKRDEMGAMAASVEVFKTSLLRNRALEEEAARDEASRQEQRRQEMARLADMFEQAVGGIVGAVGQASETLSLSARDLAASVEDTAGRSNTVAAAAEQASANVAVVSAAAEELSSSVGEIGRQVAQSVDISQTAVTEANSTASIVQELSHAAGKINDIIAFISNIAAQTNLLALNATIEAARAGEAGRGFAVVAAEVKELATQTAKATADISDQIGAIQSSTDRAVTAIGSIAGTIQSMSDYSSAIASAVEQQGSATHEIVRNVAQASAGTAEVTANISTVAATTQSVGDAAGRVNELAGDLSTQSQALAEEMKRFLATIRAA